MIKPEIPQHLLTEEWARLPTKPGERREGLSRTTILELWEQGDVEIASVRKRGSQKAIRLLNIASLRNFLKTCVEEPRDAPFPGKKSKTRRSQGQKAELPRRERAEAAKSTTAS
jgi:hypothetical protein